MVLVPRVFPALWPYYAFCVAFGVFFVLVAVIDHLWVSACGGAAITVLAAILARVGYVMRHREDRD